MQIQREAYSATIPLAILAWLASLARELVTGAERHGLLRGPIRPAARPFSIALDLVAHERDELSCAVSRLGLGPPVANLAVGAPSRRSA